MDDDIVFECPHCKEIILVKKGETNCCIFRHGILKDNFEQINPHLDKQNCDSLKEQDKIYGCGKPFRLIPEKNFEVEVCDYI